MTATIHAALKDGVGGKVGRIAFEDSQHGLIITPDLVGLSGGPHGVHVHERADCGSKKMGDVIVPAGAAGSHYDPKNTGFHSGPYGDGHLGDLPNIIVEHDGTASIPVLAPRLKVADLKNRSLIIHGGADRYTGHARRHHGKGGMRMYCGVIK